jgi:hypothetical protein
VTRYASIIVLGIAALGASAIAAPVSQDRRQEMIAHERQKEAARLSDYRQNTRLKASLSIDGYVCPTEELIGKISERISVGLLPGTTWAGKPVGVVVEDVQASAFMDAMATLFAGRWFWIGDNDWILAPSGDAAQPVRREKERREAARGGLTSFARAADRKQDQFIDMLTSRQWARLAAGEKLTVRDMSPEQWAILREGLLLLTKDPAGPFAYTPRPEALQGKVTISLWNPGDGPRIAFRWPTARPSPAAQIQVGVRQLEDGTWLRPYPDLTNPIPAPLPAQDARPLEYRQDPKLNLKLTLEKEELAWPELLETLSRQVKKGLLVQGEWLKKPVPFAVKDRSPVQVMDELAALSKGRWEEVGPIWVLAPAPRASGVDQ